MSEHDDPGIPYFIRVSMLALAAFGSCITGLSILFGYATGVIASSRDIAEMRASRDEMRIEVATLNRHREDDERLLERISTKLTELERAVENIRDARTIERPERPAR